MKYLHKTKKIEQKILSFPEILHLIKLNFGYNLNKIQSTILIHK